MKIDEAYSIFFSYNSIALKGVSRSSHQQPIISPEIILEGLKSNFEFSLSIDEAFKIAGDFGDVLGEAAANKRISNQCRYSLPHSPDKILEALKIQYALLRIPGGLTNQCI